jgi:DNA repair exonuclease SbcCD ATPase subunit
VTYDLCDGTIVVNGDSEAGKSQRFVEAPLYGMFGIQALEDSIEDVVTFGEPVSSLKVMGQVGPYKFSRTKSSASVEGPGLKIAGQGQVTEFFCDLFGITKGSEKYILVSEQNETAGILKKKPSEVTKFIEGIAGFQKIDEIIENFKIKFPSGNNTVYEEQLEEVAKNLEVSKEEELPDLDELKGAVKTQEQVVALSKSEGQTLKNQLKTYESELSEVKQHNRDVKNQEKLYDIFLKESKTLEEEIHVLQRKTYRDVEGVAEAKEVVENFTQAVEARTAWEWVQGLEPIESSAIGSAEKLEQRVKDCEGLLQIHEQDIAATTQEIRFLKSQTLVEKVCDKCGQDIESFEKINAEIDEKIQKVELQLGHHKKQYLLMEEEYKIVKSQLLKHRELENEKPACTLIRTDDSRTPHTYSFDGPEPPKVDKEALKSANKTLNLLSEVNKEKEVDHKRLTKLLNTEVEPVIKPGELKDSEPLKEKVMAAEANLSEQEEVYKAEVEKLKTLDKRLTIGEERLKAHVERLNMLNMQKKTLNEKLKEDKINGLILRDLRKAKTEVLNNVWDKILVITSKIFSDMRGQESEIVRTEKGFRVDGGSVQGLSGSTQSILGIALRSALRDIFAPNCNFMFFDEVNAGCDVSRAAMVCGVVNSIPGQKIFITHEKESAMVADQIIEVS